MEKQRDKAAKRAQRKLQRESGIPLPDDGDTLDIDGEPGEGEAGESAPGEPAAGELVETTDQHPGPVK